MTLSKKQYRAILAAIAIAVDAWVVAFLLHIVPDWMKFPVVVTGIVIYFPFVAILSSVLVSVVEGA